MNLECYKTDPNSWWFSNDFTDHELTLLRVSFATFNRCRLEQLGMEAFMKLFDDYPEAFAIFVGKQVLPESRDEIQYSWETRHHAVRVLSILERTLFRLNRPADFSILISGLVSRHLAYGATTRFVIGLLGCFKSALTDEVGKLTEDYLTEIETTSSELESLWCKFFKSLGMAMVGEMTAVELFLQNQRQKTALIKTYHFGIHKGKSRKFFSIFFKRKQ